MADKEKKQSEFVVNDRRLFGMDGELRQDVVEAEERREEREQEEREAAHRINEERAAQREVAPVVAATEPPPTTPDELHEAPSAAEQQASVDAYRESTREMDKQIHRELDKQGQAHRAKDFEMDFEKFAASLYMSALMQLGLAAPQGGKPQVDLMGARQTIDILGILKDKTKSNLTPAEENMLQNVLYELRMAYLEVTNLIANPPEGRVPAPFEKR
ncbi:MAG TPA: DUF1844 domain-containing protein [Terriglobales bacterium]